MPRDQIESHAVGVTGEPVLHCAQCGAVVTRPAWAIAMNGVHEHVFFNPSGRLFRVVCFREAPGAADASPLSQEFSWFAGYGWRIVACRQCRVHLGWRFEAVTATATGAGVFFGLIKPMLTGSAKSAPGGP